MREIAYVGRFKSDWKKISKAVKSADAILESALILLCTDAELPPRYKDHPLKGGYTGWRDCHLKPDLVLIYRKVDDTGLELARIGSHSEVFE